MALHHFAMDRPGGAPAVRTDAARRQRYDAWLMDKGHVNEVVFIRSQLEGDRQAHFIISGGTDRFFSMGTLVKFVGFWSVSLFLLSNGLGLLTLGAMAGLLGRIPQVRYEEPFSPKVTATVLLGLALPFLVPAGAKVGLFLVMFVICFIALWRHEAFGASVLRRVRLVAVPLGCVLLLISAGTIIGAARQQRTLVDGVSGMLEHEGRFYADLMGRPWPN